MRRAIVALFLIAIFTTLSLGCSHSESGSLTGSWTRTVTIDDVQFDVMITFNEDDTFQFQLLEETAGHNDTPGKFEISGDRVTFTDDDCGNSGEYFYSIADNRLSFTPDDETCQERAAILSGDWDRSAAE